MPALRRGDPADAGASEGNPRGRIEAADQVPQVQEAVAVFEPVVRARSQRAGGARGQRALRIWAEFLQQALERLAVRHAESRGIHARTDYRERPLARGQVDLEP